MLTLTNLPVRSETDLLTPGTGDASEWGSTSLDLSDQNDSEILVGLPWVTGRR